jgi:hypothetical protein
MLLCGRSADAAEFEDEPVVRPIFDHRPEFHHVTRAIKNQSEFARIERRLRSPGNLFDAGPASDLFVYVFPKRQ